MSDIPPPTDASIVSQYSYHEPIGIDPRIPHPTAFRLPPPILTGKKKVYVITAGVLPGLYRSWAEAQAQILQVKNSSHKSFANWEQALVYYSDVYNRRLIQILPPPPPGTGATRGAPFLVLSRVSTPAPQAGHVAQPIAVSDSPPVNWRRSRTASSRPVYVIEDSPSPECSPLCASTKTSTGSSSSLAKGKGKAKSRKPPAPSGSSDHSSTNTPSSESSITTSDPPTPIRKTPDSRAHLYASPVPLSSQTSSLQATASSPPLERRLFPVPLVANATVTATATASSSSGPTSLTMTLSMSLAPAPTPPRPAPAPVREASAPPLPVSQALSFFNGIDDSSDNSDCGHTGVGFDWKYEFTPEDLENLMIQEDIEHYLNSTPPHHINPALPGMP
ncbi:hypothetical protein D9619_013673 [Psilocybe cf. subviscida]|uniref:Ribonuclease H1 N-terminal domain-containing protein n=1 Tax=Psilocybe cf. subviscida TaxID=2480587 RepID=A0A8H5EVG8_9AGAR|nr:hypothetical protein D9619_013673 [Psilocybe cf. subviscida]